LPILWIGVALVLGQFRLRQIERKQELMDRLSKRTREAEGLAGYAADLERRSRQLERQITSSGVAQGASVLDAIAHLQSPHADLPRAFVRICNAAFPGAGITVYAVQPSGLEPGFTTVEPATSTSAIAASHALYRMAIVGRRSLSVLNAADETTLAGHGLAAVPVVNGETGRVIGLIKLERGDGRVLNEGTLDRLAVVARLIAPRMSEPRIVVDNTERAPSAGDTLSQRLTRGWRQFSWQTDSIADRPAPKSPAAGTPAAGEDGRGSPRPRKLK
jgi:hypothetical protein